jgi:peroxiredoxin
MVGVGLGLLALLLVVRVLMLAHDAVLGPASQSTSVPAPTVGHPAPSATFLDLQNHHVRLSSFRGKVVVLNFWYATCEPCLTEMPALQQAYAEDSSRGLVVLGADTSDDTPTAADFVRQHGITYPIVRDVGAHIAITFGVIGTPSSFVLDRHGIIRYKVVGPLDMKTLTADVNALLAQH